MARTLTAYLKREDVPERKALQQAIDALAFPLALDDAYVPFETSGYLPCTLDGEDAGFDLRFKDAAAAAALPSGIGDRDTAVTCKWCGDPREEAAARAFCAALAKDFGALVHEDGAPALVSFEQLLAKAKAARD
jgi:hypothetical protein